MARIPEGIKDLEWYDASKIKEFQLCPQRYYYRYERHLLLKEDRPTDLAFGLGVHEALESFYLGRHGEMVPCPHEIPTQSSCQYCEARAGETRRFIADFLRAFPKDLEKAAKTQINGLRLLSHYIAARTKMPEPFVVKAVEQSFILPMVYPGVNLWYYVGKMDLIIEWDGKVMPLDHKTASRFGDMFEKQFRLDIQITGYIYALGRLMNLPVKSAIVNAFRATDKIDSDSFLRKMTDRRPDELVRWEEEVHYWVSRIRQCRATGIWPMHDHSCFAYMRECPNRTLCTLPKEARPEAIIRAYKQDTWEPI